MLVEELDLSDEIRQALAEQGFVELHPPQAEAIPIALTGRNVVAAIPTASGKSLIGYCTALKRLVEEGKLRNVNTSRTPIYMKGDAMP